MAGMPVMAGRTERELDHVENAELDRACRVQPLEHRRGRRRRALAEDLRAARRDHAAPVVHVLVRHRHAMQRSAQRTAREILIGETRSGERKLVVAAHEAVQARMHGLHAPERSLRRGNGGDALLADRARQLCSGELQDRLRRHGALLLCSAVEPAGSFSNASRAYPGSAAFRTAESSAAYFCARAGSVTTPCAASVATTHSGVRSFSMQPPSVYSVTRGGAPVPGASRPSSTGSPTTCRIGTSPPQIDSA